MGPIAARSPGSAVTLRPVEWEVRLPLSGEAIAIVRAVSLGPRGEVYLRAVTPDAERSQRELIGYWGSPQEAHDGVLALYERRTNRGAPPTLPLVSQKPPPEAGGAHGRAARANVSAAHRG